MTTKPSPSMPCKCRLIRPDGIQRVYFRAESVEDAQRRACRILKKKALPEGWKLIVDGKAAECFPRAEPAPRPFQVGDRVERVGHELFVPVGSKGTVIASDKFSVRIEWEWKRSGSSKNDVSSYGIADAEKFVRLLEPAPQPKAEAPANVLQRYVDELRTMNAQKNEQIEKLQEAVVDAGEQVAKALERRDDWAKESNLWKMRYEAAQAKLDDLSALHSVMSMAKASTKEDWDFTTLMADVLARG